VVLGKAVVLPRAEKVLDVIGAPLNKISRHAVRVNEVVDAPADFPGDLFHGIKLRLMTLMPFVGAVKQSVMVICS
jgi:hypothetical protein